MSATATLINSRDPIIDELMDLYVGWREECVAVRRAYESWRLAPDEERHLAFVAYRAALDREERAAECYAALTESTSLVPDALPEHEEVLAGQR